MKPSFYAACNIKVYHAVVPRFLEAIAKWVKNGD